MDLAERIQRRRNGRTKDALVVDWDALNPAYHFADPVGRAAVLEAALDGLDPIFDEELPPAIYLWGPGGGGKSAIVTALMAALEAELADRRVRYTATRGRSAMSGLRFVYVDGRRETTRFKLYHRILNEIRDDTVPQRGIGTDNLLADIEAEVGDGGGVLVAVDHVSMPGSMALAEVQDYVAAIDNARVLGVGRMPPDRIGGTAPEVTVHVPAYDHELVDVLMVRGARGLSRSLDHGLARRVAEWSKGDAHDALSALYLAAVYAEEADEDHLGHDHVDRAMSAVPRDGTSLSHLLSLSETERAVLCTVVRNARDADLQIDEMAGRIADDSSLTKTTAKRLLYELAQEEVLERHQVTTGEDLVGRRPSRVRPTFAPELFAHVSAA